MREVERDWRSISERGTGSTPAQVVLRPGIDRRGGTARGENGKYTTWRSRGTSKWSRPLPAGQSPAAPFDSKSSRVAGGEGQPP